MADEVPVCDVLCEAMEYLSKLGSNLRARSENLKEKRIRKDKLKNYHAVQKAADKVLMICQLSKKSLDNVECGVRKVLTLMSSSQNPGATADVETPTSSGGVQDTEKYRYFKYRSYKLKVAKRVPVKHFMSARVLARNMSLSILDNYPVYHNCKLYRTRKRNGRDISRKSTEKIESANMRNDELEQNKTEENCESNALENSHSSDAEKESPKVGVDEEKRRMSVCSNKSETVSQNIEDRQVESNHDSNELDDKQTQSLKIGSNKRKERLSQSSKTSKGGEFSDSENFCIKRRSRKNTLRKNSVIDDDTSNSSIGKQENLPEDGENITNNENEHSLHKLINSNSNKESPDTSHSPSNIEELKSLSSNVEDLEANQHVTNTDEDETSVAKPLIKCVNISKLLKPDITDNKAEIPKKKNQRKKSDSPSDEGSSKNKENVKHSCKKKKQTSKSDEHFWAQKRKEVSAFVAKKFVINVTRLPTLSEDFLRLHNLRKIIENDKVICELANRNGKGIRLNGDSVNSPDPINVVKNALLNDSDSDKSDASLSKSPLPLAEIEKTVKNVLLNDSDSELNKSLLSFEEINKTIEKVLKDSVINSENETIENKSNTRDERENIINNSQSERVKDALLNDSDSSDKSADKRSGSEKLCENESTRKDKNLKQALLAESDSEKARTKSQSMRDKEDNDPKDKNRTHEDVDTHRTESKQNENAEKHTQAEVSPSKDPDPNKSDDNLEITPSKKKKHKRKSMMESMHAKKMLLTYSSSSDTEDEQLRNALKEIKDSLLKGVSSSDDENKKKKVEKPLSSEDDIDLKKKRKKRKHRKDSSNNSAGNESSNSPITKNFLDQESEYSRKSGLNSDERSNSSRKKMGRSRAQPGGSSQNSDSQDPNDKDIDRLTNLNSLTKNRRRRDSASTNTDASSRRSARMGKTPLISEDNMLKAESSSDAGSAAESDPGEELPSISLTGLNGSSVSHLAKDDLLEESDTSASHKGDSDDIKKTDDSDEEAVKLKRRKAHLISSDSEAGSSRRKVEKAVKLSDFEDSEDDSSEPAKKSKRKKKEEESDASVGSTSSNDGSKKKRRRIKQIDSDVSGSDTENEGRNKHGRKNIRKVMGKNQLEEATKKAAREEKERIARIAERQKVYNNLEFDESGKPDEVVLEKVVLDFDPETKEPLIQVDRGLVKKLKPHQANGIKFMWDACFESVKRIKKDKGSGCILAHCMGLGKTLQVVSLTHTLLTHRALTSVQRVLVVCPLSTVLNWVNEFRMWLKHAETDFDVDVYELSRHKQNSERAYQLQQWFEHGGVCVLGYEMFRNLSADNSKKFKKKMLRNFQEALVDPGPDLVVCDEGHLLKNEKTSLSQSMNRVKTRRRIVLTGTPLQNNLKEYYCMVQFVKPNLLGKYNEYLNRFVNPITNGQYTDSTEHDIRIMKRRSHVLHKMLDGAVQRRDYGVLAPFLPPKHEYVLFITLTDVQVKLYQYYLDNYSRRPLPGKSSGFLFPDFQSLQRIWTHPLVLKYNSERYEIMQQKKREREEEDSEGSLVDFIDDDSTPDESSTEESSDDLSDLSDDSRKKSKKKKSAKKSKAKDTKVSTRRGTRANPVEMEEEEPSEVVELKNENPTEWWIKLVEEEELEDMRNSHKLVLLFDILRQCETIGDKLLVFSQSLYSLDLIEHFLGKVDEATQDGRIDEKLGGHVGSWSPGVDYFRLDGSTSCENRSIWCKNFNREDNPRARLFLISTRAGGLGINLVAANRVVIFDVSWNPSHDVQSIFRVYRFGQKKPCYVYRFLAMGTMEEKIYERQVTKQAISKRVIDEQQIDRHYAENDLAELYKFEASPPVPRPIPPLPKDRLFAEMLREHEAQIYKYHEHDSLLENKEEETLSEEERKAAWEDFENEKNRPPPAPFPSGWPMHNGMMPGLLAQQQQQLAYAALAAMLRKDMPNINDNQIRDMLPLIYNANPALMQKMSEIYKYSQPGMMNPGMMNPVMGSVTGGSGGGMGGTSGLQYEPPWQRQHQQQQQMRLQQLMQQNQMGAKYYAGGLGSRDPVAMALQQQRAREIMAGERARPRGRPPLQPRPPSLPSHSDVVNLDSD